MWVELGIIVTIIGAGILAALSTFPGLVNIF